MASQAGLLALAALWGVGLYVALAGKDEKRKAEIEEKRLKLRFMVVKREQMQDIVEKTNVMSADVRMRQKKQAQRKQDIA